MEHSYLLNPKGVAVAVIFSRVGNSLRPQTSEAVQLMVINDLQKVSGGFKSTKDVFHDKKSKREVDILLASAVFPSSGTKKPDGRVQPTQHEKKMRRLTKQHFKR
jgi:hypothetical protein